MKQALGAHNVVPTLDFSLDVNFAESWKNDELKKEEVSRENSYKTFNSSNFKKQDVSGWEKLFEGNSTADLRDTSRDEDETELLTFSSKANGSNKKEHLETQLENEDTGIAFQVGLNYVVAQMPRDAYIRPTGQP